jgi:hypothetical protein
VAEFLSHGFTFRAMAAAEAVLLIMFAVPRRAQLQERAFSPRRSWKARVRVRSGRLCAARIARPGKRSIHVAGSGTAPTASWIFLIPACGMIVTSIDVKDPGGKGLVRP